MRCIIHRWFYVSSTDGTKNLFSGEFIKREDRFCRDCDKMQIRLNQFTAAQQHELIKKSKSCFTSDWITFREGDAIDKLTRRWLRLTSK